MNREQETLYTVALTRIGHFTPAAMSELYRRAGSATAVMENRTDLQSIMPDIAPRIAEAFRDTSEAIRRAQAEIEYDNDNGIRILTMNDEDYPRRLSECPDAPLALFYKGSASLNPLHAVCMVGTRRCTAYGQDIVRRFCADLRAMCHDVLIVSGLAYGVDINVHRQALANGFDTVAVLAHGLDTLYPPRHRATADKMLHQGGLLTEYTTCTNADKMNFVRRNRIVAGISDACIVVESAEHGGSLITARIAQDYHRDVFAFPGAVVSEYSQGCNNLIRDNAASLITSARDFVSAMGWQDESQIRQARQSGIERQMFPELNTEEQSVVNALKKANDLQIGHLTVRTGLAVPQLTATLFTLEMKGVVKMMAGGCYHLLA